MDELFSISKTKSDVAAKLSTALQAAYKREDSQTIAQLGSIFVEAKVQRAGMEKLVGRDISEYFYKRMRYHHDTYGAGARAPEEQIHERGGVRKVEIIGRYVDWLVENGVRTAIAVEVRYSNGEIVRVAKIYRKESIEQLIKSFIQMRKEEMNLSLLPRGLTGSRDYVSLQCTVMHEIAEVVCPQIIKSLAALDFVTEVHGRLNFKLLRSFLEDVMSTSRSAITTLPDSAIAADLIKKLECMHTELLQISFHNEEFMKSRQGLWSAAHLGGSCTGTRNCNDGPACHCKFFAWNKRDFAVAEVLPGAEVCGHVHSGVCPECEACILYPGKVETFVFNATQTVRLIKLAADVVPDAFQPDVVGNARVMGEDRFERQATALNYHLRRFRHYLAHQARLCNEAAMDAEIESLLKADHSRVWMDMDFAMRLLSAKYRESMTEWFGKKGIAWHGIKMAWYDRAKGKVVYYFMNQILTDSLEDAEMVSMLIAHAIIQHCRRHGHTKLILTSDGAGAYAGVTLLARSAFFFQHREVAIEIERHYTGEGGGGKGPVDTNFAVMKSWTLKAVVAGMGSLDISDYESLVIALNNQEVPRTVNLLVKTTRRPDVTLSGHEKRFSGTQGYALRVFQYNDDRSPKAILFYCQSGLINNLTPTAQLEKETADAYLDGAKIQQFWKPEVDRQTIVNPGKGNVDVPTSESDDRTVYRSPSTVCGVVVTAEEKKRRLETIEDKRKLVLAKADAEMTAAVKVPVWMACPTPGCVREFSTVARLNSHKLSGKCQINGNPYSQSRTPIAPTEYANMSTRDIAIKMLMAKTAGDRICVLPEESSEVWATSAGVGTIVGAIVTHFLPGWACRETLKHLPVTVDQRVYVKQMWDQGLRTGNKVCAALVVKKMVLVGTQQDVDEFSGELYWEEKFQQTGGAPFFDKFDILEEWRVGQLYQQIGTAIKATAKMERELRKLTDQEKLFELRALLEQEILVHRNPPSDLTGFCVQALFDYLSPIVIAADCVRNLNQKKIEHVPLPEGVSKVTRLHKRALIQNVIHQIGSNDSGVVRISATDGISTVSDRTTAVSALEGASQVFTSGMILASHPPFSPATDGLSQPLTEMAQNFYPTCSFGPVATVADDRFPLAEDDVEYMEVDCGHDLNFVDDFSDPDDNLILLDCIVDDLHSAITR